MTRGMVVTVLWRLDGEKYANYAMKFDDVKQGQWYTEAIRWAASEGIVNGYDNDTFGPDDSITREQFVAILYRYVQKQGKGFTGTWMFNLGFNDKAEISDWAFEPVCWCYMNDIIKGKDGNRFDLKATATRAEVATMMMRYLSL